MPKLQPASPEQWGKLSRWLYEWGQNNNVTITKGTIVQIITLIGYPREEKEHRITDYTRRLIFNKVTSYDGWKGPSKRLWDFLGSITLPDELKVDISVKPKEQHD